MAFLAIGAEIAEFVAAASAWYRTYRAAAVIVPITTLSPPTRVDFVGEPERQPLVGKHLDPASMTSGDLVFLEAEQAGYRSNPSLSARTLGELAHRFQERFPTLPHDGVAATFLEKLATNSANSAELSSFIDDATARYSAIIDQMSAEYSHAIEAPTENTDRATHFLKMTQHLVNQEAILADKKSLDDLRKAPPESSSKITPFTLLPPSGDSPAIRLAALQPQKERAYNTLAPEGGHWDHADPTAEGPGLTLAAIAHRHATLLDDFAAAVASAGEAPDGRVAAAAERAAAAHRFTRRIATHPECVDAKLVTKELASYIGDLNLDVSGWADHSETSRASPIARERRLMQEYQHYPEALALQSRGSVAHALGVAECVGTGARVQPVSNAIQDQTFTAGVTR